MNDGSGMNSAQTVRFSFAALVETRRSLERVLSEATSLPPVDAPRIVGGSRLTTILDGIGELVTTANQHARTDLDQLIGSLDVIVLTFATTDEGLAQLALGSNRNIGAEARP